MEQRTRRIATVAVATVAGLVAALGQYSNQADDSSNSQLDDLSAPSTQTPITTHYSSGISIPDSTSGISALQQKQMNELYSPLCHTLDGATREECHGYEIDFREESEIYCNLKIGSTQSLCDHYAPLAASARYLCKEGDMDEFKKVVYAGMVATYPRIREELAPDATAGPETWACEDNIFIATGSGLSDMLDEQGVKPTELRTMGDLLRK